MVRTVKNLSVVQETGVQSLGQEDPLEKGMATHSSILTGRIPWTEEGGSYSSCGRKKWDMSEWLTLFLSFLRSEFSSEFPHCWVTAKPLKWLTRTKGSSTTAHCFSGLLSCGSPYHSLHSENSSFLPIPGAEQQVLNLRVFAHAFPSYAITSWFASFRTLLTSYTFRALFPDHRN